MLVSVSKSFTLELSNEAQVLRGQKQQVQRIDINYS